MARTTASPGGRTQQWTGQTGPVSTNLLGEPPATLLPADPGQGELDAGADPIDVARRHPASPAGWAAASHAAWRDGRVVESYAFARVGYHRGLDALRRHGWKGYGPIPWQHEPNRGFLSCLAALGRASAAIGENDEAARIADFLQQASPAAATELGMGWAPPRT